MRILPTDKPGTGIPYPEPPPEERRGPRTITETGNLQGQADPTKQGDEIPKPITFGLQSDYYSPEDPPPANPTGKGWQCPTNNTFWDLALYCAT